MKQENENRATVLALTTVCLWSTAATAFKLGLKDLDPIQILWIACCVSTLFFGFARLFISTPPYPLKSYLYAAGLGFLNPFAYYLILFEAYLRLPAQIAQPLNYTWAITLALLAVPILKQKLTNNSILGIFISYAGVLLLLTQGEFEKHTTLDPLGILLAIGSTFLWAFYWLASIRITMHPVTLMLSGFLTVTPIITLICLMGNNLPSLTFKSILIGTWIGLFEMGMSFLLWRSALAHTKNAGRIGQFIFLSPFISLILIYHFLEETIQVTTYIALPIIVLGLLIVNRRLVDRD